MEETTIYEGGCLCGNIRYRVEGPVSNPHTCSCRQCQRQSGSLTQVWVMLQKSQIAWVGPGSEPRTWRSSATSSRMFCAVCGSSIGVMNDGPTVALTVGTFDSPARKEFAPVSHSFVDRRPEWWSVCVAGEV